MAAPTSASGSTSPTKSCVIRSYASVIASGSTPAARPDAAVGEAVAGREDRARQQDTDQRDHSSSDRVALACPTVADRRARLQVARRPPPPTPARHGSSAPDGSSAARSSSAPDPVTGPGRRRSASQVGAHADAAPSPPSPSPATTTRTQLRGERFAEADRHLAGGRAREVADGRRRARSRRSSVTPDPMTPMSSPSMMNGQRT